MYYHVSDTIAAKNPELIQEISKIDSFLKKYGRAPFFFNTAASILKIRIDLLKRILPLYEKANFIRRHEVFICPEHNIPLDLNEVGELWCDICEKAYEPDQCNNEVEYQLLLPNSSLQKNEEGRMVSFKNGYAVVIGISNYLNPDFAPNLSTAVKNDALDIANLLCDSKYCGYPQDHVILLTNDGADSTSIRNGLEWLAQVTNSDDTALVFFSGHGGRDDNQSFLIPYDCDDLNMAISGDELTLLLQQIKAERLVVLLDSCHSGGSAELKGAKNQHMSLKLGFGDHALDKLQQGKGRVIIAACLAEEYSHVLPNMPNSVFTFYLLEALKGNAHVPEDGLIHILDVFSYLDKKIPQRVTEQTPLIKAVMQNNFPIALYMGGTKGASRNGSQSQQVDDKNLRKVLVERFNKEDLDLLCSDVEQYLVAQGIDIVFNLDIVGGTRQEKIALNMIDYLKRRGYLDALVECVRELRPGVI